MLLWTVVYTAQYTNSIAKVNAVILFNIFHRRQKRLDMTHEDISDLKFSIGGMPIAALMGYAVLCLESRILFAFRRLLPPRRRKLAIAKAEEVFATRVAQEVREHFSRTLPGNCFRRSQRQNGGEGQTHHLTTQLCQRIILTKKRRRLAVFNCRHEVLSW